VSSIDAMGPGTPTPLTMTKRTRGKGSPLAYKPKAHRVQADVAKGAMGQNVAAHFQPAPPIRPPGAEGISKGTIIDRQA
jgi:hypothetical protein